MGALFANNAATTLSNPLTSGATTLSVTSSTTFPTLGSGDYFLATLIGYDANSNESAWEIIKVTDVTGTAWTIERAQEGTTALSWPQATRIEQRLTAGTLLSPSQYTETLNGKLTASDNLSDVTDLAQARINIGVEDAEILALAGL